jgi:hypothetical protein
VPVADRPWFTEATAEPDPVRAIRLHARNLCWIVRRVASLLRALETAAVLWALPPDAYLRLVHDGGWPLERYPAWLTDLLERLALP